MQKNTNVNPFEQKDYIPPYASFTKIEIWLAQFLPLLKGNKSPANILHNAEKINRLSYEFFELVKTDPEGTKEDIENSMLRSPDDNQVVLQLFDIANKGVANKDSDCTVPIGSPTPRGKR